MTATEFADQIAGCKIYYGDNTIAKCTSVTTWADSPYDNVQVVLVFLKEKDGQGRPKRIIYSGMDFYYLNGGVIETDYDSGKPDSPNDVIKAGKWLDPKLYKELMERVVSDYDF